MSIKSERETIRAETSQVLTIAIARPSGRSGHFPPLSTSTVSPGADWHPSASSRATLRADGPGVTYGDCGEARLPLAADLQTASRVLLSPRGEGATPSETTSGRRSRFW